MVLFFGLVFSVDPPGNFSADALGSLDTIFSEAMILVLIYFVLA